MVGCNIPGLIKLSRSVKPKTISMAIPYTGVINVFLLFKIRRGIPKIIQAKPRVKYRSRAKNILYYSIIYLPIEKEDKKKITNYV